ncbi:SLC13 family permease [Algoriphagus sediminis]|uniref:DASS family sodium-coupled anion symporter n=1 Tax=Algoriphagus sediminis TaxID=3057113 RepID=A0ABT7YD26_9BACT|nr:DASS family sodium-coupled anion symporter [Algoriphagus sediminis]MDN3204430.1 DASS family sodium-coupled anion symporter [Algoriphagus sediminis]
MNDSRIAALRYYVHKKWSTQPKVILFFASLLLAFLITRYIFNFEAYETQGRALFILLAASFLWITEAIPVFAVSFLIMGYSIYLLDDGHLYTVNPDWQIYISQWSGPVMWLFLGGFMLAEGAKKTKFDLYFSQLVISRFGTKPSLVLLGVMFTTGLLSMFISNTATAVMMLSVIQPLLRNLEDKDPFRKALLLGIAASATVCGMGTIIGSAPNAIAVGNMAESGIDFTFLDWMIVGIPLSVFLSFVSWVFLMKKYPSDKKAVELPTKISIKKRSFPFSVVTITFGVTVFLWTTSSLHGIPVSVIAFLPIVALTITGILNSEDIRKIPWDTLILIVGGLILGDIIRETELVDLLVSVFPAESSGLLLFIALGVIASVTSNLMSNTAAAGILIPIASGMLYLYPIESSLVVALCCSTAMFLPISTPPNSIVFSTGDLEIKEFRPLGALVALVGIVSIIFLVFLIY